MYMYIPTKYQNVESETYFLIVYTVKWYIRDRIKIFNNIQRHFSVLVVFTVVCQTIVIKPL